MNSILCVEDSEMSQSIIKMSLGAYYELTIASTIEEARSILTSKTFHLIILDINLPDGDGLRFCSELKMSQEFSLIPIFILTATNLIQEKILGFQLGIEDFIVKPFDPIELRLRIESRLKKIIDQQQLLDILSVGNLVLNFSSQRGSLQLSNENKTLEFSTTEFKLLSYLAKNKELVKSREQIITAVWGDGLHLSDRSIDSHVSRIRKKILECDYSIEAVLNSGYRFCAKKNDKHGH